jgi:hypothetical protein
MIFLVFGSTGFRDEGNLLKIGQAIFEKKMHLAAVHLEGVPLFSWRCGLCSFMWGEGTAKLQKFQSRNNCLRDIPKFGIGSPCEGSLLLETSVHHIHRTPPYDR